MGLLTPFVLQLFSIISEYNFNLKFLKIQKNKKIRKKQPAAKTYHFSF